jgi:dihydrolipoamide dehydrogenase
MKQYYDIVIIGAGPGGYVAAIRAAQLGKTVALIEKDRVGGTCMNRGCIPTKYLLHETRRFADMHRNPFLSGPVAEVGCDWPAVQAEKRRRVDRLVSGIEFLLEKNGVTVLQGMGFYRKEHEIEVEQAEGTLVLEADHLLLANGSRPAVLPFLQPDGTRVLTSCEALELEDIPRRLLIVGAGAIGLEMGTIYQRLGSEVTVLEILPQILPGADLSLARRLQRILKNQGLDIQLRMQIEGVEKQENGLTLTGTCLKDGTAFALAADKVLLATGRKSESAGCENGALHWDKTGCLRVNDSWETDVPGVFAIGDLTGGKLLAHKASHEAILAVENLAGARHTRANLVVPMAVFTDPEFASVGMTEAEARDRLGDGVKTGTFSLQANGRALTLGEQEGAVKVVADRKDRVQGAHILAPHASELITEMTLAISRGLTLSEIANTVHIHPTLSEAVMEAVLHGNGRAIHALNL